MVVQIRFVTHDGRSGAFEAKVGESLMLAAKAHGVPGVEAECGGSMVCGTCHLFIAGDGFGRVGPPSAMEAELLDYGLYPQPNSRLSCQVVVTEAMDGLTVEIPSSQR
jgi:2Fe-2S ferredoxin